MIDKVIINAKKSKRKIPIYPLMFPKERLALLKSIKGIWKNKKRNPIKELNKMRRERERTFS